MIERVPLEQDIGKLGILRTKEWLMYHKYQIFKLRNDRIFNANRIAKLKLHLKSLIGKFVEKSAGTRKKIFDKTVLPPKEEKIPLPKYNRGPTSTELDEVEESDEKSTESD